MTRRTGRGFVKKDEALAKLEVGRRGAVQVCTEAKIDSAEYLAAQHVIDSIDQLASSLTGDPTYFHAQ